MDRLLMLMRAVLAIVLVLASASAPARADQILGPSRIDNSNRVILPGGPTLGRWQAGKYNSTPDALTLPSTDQGSTGEIGGLTATPSIGGVPGTLSWIVAYLSGTTNIATLRTTTRAIFTTAQTLGYYAAGDGGAATYRYDPTDTSTADDGCGVIVGVGGARWKLVWNTSINLRQCGAKGDDSDDTARVQVAANFAAPAGAALYVPPASTFKLTSPLTVTGTPLRILGAGVDPGNLNGVRGKGSWLHLAHLGVGISFSNTGYAGPNEIIGVGTYRDQPVPTSTFTPINADYDVVVNAAESIIDMTMLNPTLGLKITGNVGMRTWVKKLQCQCLTNGILGDLSFDKIRIDYYDGWPIWRNVDAVNTWTANNNDAVYLRRIDGLDGGLLFTIFSRSALRYGKNTTNGAGTGVSSEHHWNAVYADGTTKLISIDAGVRYLNTHINWATVLHGTYSTAADYAIEDNGASDNSITVDDLKANNLRGGVSYLTGARTKLNVKTFHEGTFNKRGGTTGFVALNGAETRIKDYNRANPNQTIYGTDPIPGFSFTAPNNNASRASGNVSTILDAGTATGTTDASGQVIVSHNAGQAPNVVKVTSFFPVVGYQLLSATATTFTIAPLNQTGGVIGAGVNFSLSYEVGLQGASSPTSSYQP